MKKPKKRKRQGASVPCPACGSPTRVLRTNLGERLRTLKHKRDYVVRDRRCVSPAHHRFQTEERSR